MEKIQLGDLMKDTKYDQIADKHKAPESRIKNSIIAFISGGFMGFLAELIVELLCNWFDLKRADSTVYMIIIFIFFACLFTALGFFDKWVNKLRCGLIIPITGFAHSMTSSSLDYKREGLIYGIGSNIFRLAGSVILYGVVSAWILGVIRYLLGVIG